jgi:hypothetical protein
VAPFPVRPAGLTQDIDIVYRRSAANMGRLAAARRDLRPYLRGAPPGLPCRLNEDILLEAFGVTWPCLALDRLLAVKPAAGRPRDLETLAELEAIREDHRGGPERG